MLKSSITRRSFVKTSALAGAAVALDLTAKHSLVETDVAYADAPSERQAVKTVCHGCIQLCPCIAYLEDGVVVKLEGDKTAPESKGSMCLKGMAQLHTVYSPRRVLHPMKLAGQRGSNEWEVISWDEALELAADQYIACASKYGDYSFWAATGGGGGFTGGFVQIMQTVLGSCNQISPGACQCYLPRLAVATWMWGGGNQSIADSSCLEPFNEYDPKLELLVLWGAQPSTSQTAQSGRGVADMRVGRGVKTVVIDPYMTPDAAKADIWLPVRPGSDTALILSWYRYIIKNELYNEEFVKYWTNLPFLINPETKFPYKAEEVWPDYVNPAEDPDGVYDTPAYVCLDAKTGTIQPFPYTAPEDSPVDPAIFTTAVVNGVEAKTAGQIYKEEAEPWTLEKAAEICWLEADKIEDAIKMYTEANYAGIAHGVFSDMMESSSQAPMGLVGLDMIMGRVNRPGATLTGEGARSVPKTRPTVAPVTSSGRDSIPKRYGVGWTVGYTKEENDRINEAAKKVWADKGRDPEAMQKGFAQQNLDRLGMTKYKGAYYWVQSHIASVRKAIETGEPYKPRFLYETSGNKLANLGDAGAWYKIRNESDFVVHQYTYMTSFTLEFVDLFLPMEEWLEFETASSRVTQLNKTYIRRRVIHLGETAHNYATPIQFVERVCDKLGGDDKIFDKDIMYWLHAGTISEEEKKWPKTYGYDTWEEVLEHDDECVPVVVPEEKFWIKGQHLMKVSDDLPAGFGTMSRKCEVYCTMMLHLSRTGFPYVYPFEQEPCEDYTPICTYTEQTESPLTDKDYPIVLTSGRTHYWHHSLYRHAAFNRELMPEPEVIMNPKTAEEYGIKDSDWVKLTSRRGSTHGVARVTEGIAPGVVWMERFWNPECYDSTQKSPTSGWEECNVAVLTMEDTANECFGSATYRGFQVKIEKSTKPDRVWVEPKEFEPFMPTLQSEPQTEVLFK